MNIVIPINEEQRQYEYSVNLSEHPLKQLVKIEPNKGKIISGQVQQIRF